MVKTDTASCSDIIEQSGRSVIKRSATTIDLRSERFPRGCESDVIDHDRSVLSLFFGSDLIPVVAGRQLIHVSLVQGLMYWVAISITCSSMVRV